MYGQRQHIGLTTRLDPETDLNNFSRPLPIGCRRFNDFGPADRRQHPPPAYDAAILRSHYVSRAGVDSLLRYVIACC